MSSIKKILLDKKKLKRANIIFYKQNRPGNTMPQLSLMGNHQIKEWIPFTDQDHEMMAKDFANSLVAFKIYLDISVTVEGRSYTYKQFLQVDPMDKFEQTMRTRTHFWNTFMLRGQYKCIVMVQYKGKDDDIYIAPNCFEKTFEELGIMSNAQITLVELRNYKSDDGDVDAGEGGEDENEEMEDEQQECTNVEP